VPSLATCIFLIFYNELELGAEIDPGMVLTPLPSGIGLDGDRTHRAECSTARPQLSLIARLFNNVIHEQEIFLKNN